MSRRVEVEWIDSTTRTGWMSSEEADAVVHDESLLHRSIGWVYREEDFGLALIQSKADNYDSIANLLLIPRVAIRKVTNLRAGRSPESDEA
jgi:hypothetical protein